jgi:tetratricopeptide (TPR) repeat protein
MNLRNLVVGLLAAVAVAFAQPVDIDTTTPEGKLLQQIGTEEAPDQKVLLLEQFIEEYPDSGNAKWVLAQLPPLYAGLGQPDKSLSWCEKSLEKDPVNAAGAHACLKTAEAQNDPDLLRKWAVATHTAAAKAVSAPKPEFEYEEDEAEWDQAVEFARQVGQYAEWAIYNAALQAQDPGKKSELTEALRGVNAESEHLPVLEGQVFRGYLQAGQADKAAAMADAAVASGKADSAMLAVAANHYYGQKQTDKAMDYCDKLIASLDGAEAPAGVDAAAWAAQQKAMAGQAYWMKGVTASNQRKYVTADRDLRKALPNLTGQNAMIAEALFHLGLSNYQLGAKDGNQERLLAAHKYTKQCAAMSSPFQAQARKNLAAIESQYRIK